VAQPEPQPEPLPEPAELTPEELHFMKLEMLTKLAELKSYGVDISRDYDMDSDYESMKREYDLRRAMRDKTNSVNLYEQVMMTVLGVGEYVNDLYNPFTFKIKGFSKEVKNDISTYREIFADLHDKYRDKNGRTSPEMRLLTSLMGSAIIFHTSNSNIDTDTKDGKKIQEMIEREVVKRVDVIMQRFTMNQARMQQQQQQQQQYQQQYQQYPQQYQMMPQNTSNKFMPRPTSANPNGQAKQPERMVMNNNPMMYNPAMMQYFYQQQMMAAQMKTNQNNQQTGSQTTKKHSDKKKKKITESSSERLKHNEEDVLNEVKKKKKLNIHSKESSPEREDVMEDSTTRRRRRKAKKPTLRVDTDDQ
jgi:hypothetical protein